MICIPVALGWSELVPTDSTCQACWVRLDWVALFFLTPTLVCWQVIFLFSTIYHSCFPKLLLQNYICFFFFIPLYTYWKAAFPVVPTGLVIWYLPCTHQAIILVLVRAVHWLNKLCIKKHLWKFHLLCCCRSRASFEFQTEWLPLVPKTVAKSHYFNHQKYLPAFWAKYNKAGTFYIPALTNSHCIYLCTLWLCYFAQAQQLTICGILGALLDLKKYLWK